MHRIDSAGATPDGHWTDGDPGTRTPATELSDEWFNALQDELENVIVVGAGIPLNKAAHNQLLLAIQEIIAASVAPVWSTGDVKLTLKATADAGWIMCDDGTIGSASSGATTRANADTQALYTLLWTNITDAWAPVTGGRGASAAADFAANKPLRLTRLLGRAIAIAGTGAWQSTFTADAGTNELTVASNSTLFTGAAVTVASTTTLPAGLSAATTYYVIRSSATVVKLASSLANAHAGTAIDITSAGSGTHTITMALTARALGEHLGEESHVSTVSETAPHAHSEYSYHAAGVSTIGGGGENFGQEQTGSTGGGQPHNNMQPTGFLNAMIKL